MAGHWDGSLYIGDDSNEAVQGTALAETIFGSLGDDQLFGGGEADDVDGGIGNDLVEGGVGNDTLTDVGSNFTNFVGLIGHDTLNGGADDDLLVFKSVDTGDRANGGSGNDILQILLDSGGLSSLGADKPVHFVLGPNGATSILQISSIDTLVVSGIERVHVRGGMGSDTLTGGAAADTLVGSDGDDHLFGGGGADEIDGGTGVQDINGGGGQDRASFDVSAFSHNVTIANAALVDLGAAGVVRNVEIFDYLYSGAGADTYTITQSVRVAITSGDGGDQISVGDGGSVIYGGGGADVITTGAGNDNVEGGFGANIAHLGAGNDSFSHSTATLGPDAEQVWGEAGNDYLFTGSGGDQADGGANNDSLYGGEGSDRLRGGTGNDWLFGENGADTLEGGSGNDILNGDENTRTFTDTTDADQLTGGTGDDALTGGLGADRLYGGSGNDALTFTLYANDFAEVLDTALDHGFGAAGTDTLYVNGLGNNGLSDDLEVILAATTLIRVGGVTVADATGMEALVINSYSAGSSHIEGGALGDMVRSEGAANDLIRGLGGNDRLSSGSGTDTLAGGAGRDTLVAALGGADRLDAGTGDDEVDLLRYLSFPMLPIAPGIGRASGGAGNDSLHLSVAAGVLGFDGTTIKVDGVTVATVSDFESAVLTGAASGDTLRGLAGADRIDGGGGADRLTGGGGSDTLIGSGDADTLTGGLGADHFQFASLGLGADRITDFTSADRLEFNRFSFASSAGLIANANPTAHRLAPVFLYDTDTGQLSYDADGSGGGAASLIATLLNHSAAANLTAGQLIFF